MSIENIKQIMDDFDLLQLLPSLENFGDLAILLTRLAVLAGPLVLLFLGLHYFLAAPKEANYTTGYRCYFGMGSLEAWRFTQRLAGAVWGIGGLVLAIVMTVKAGALSEMELMDAMFQAGKLIAQEAVLALISVICINITVAILFDRQGNRRASWRELLGKE